MAYLLFLTPFLIITFVFFYYRPNKIINKVWALRIIQILFLTTFFIFTFLYNEQHEEFYRIFKYKGHYTGFVTDKFPDSVKNTFILFLKILTYSAIPVVAMAPSFRKNRILKVLTIGYVLPVSLINLISINTVVYGFTGNPSLSYNVNSFAFFVNALLFILMFTISFIFVIDELRNKANSLLIKDNLLNREDSKESVSKKTIKYLLPVVIIFLSIVATFPGMGFGIIFGGDTLLFKPRKSFHIWLLIFAFGSPFVFSLFFKKRSEEEQKIFLTWLSIAAFITFFDDYSYVSFANLANWPLHLCHTAIVLLLISIPFKIKTLFYFTYFVNVLGAFIALTFPNIGKETLIFEISSVRFWYNHLYDLIIPITAVSIGYFKRPKVKETVASLITFTGYYLFAVIVNAVLPAIKGSKIFGDSGKNVDYFFLNGDVLTDKFRFFKNLKDGYILRFPIFGGEAKMYYMFWFTLYLSFVFLTFATLSVYEYLYSLDDIYKDIFKKYYIRYKDRKERQKIILVENPKISRKELRVLMATKKITKEEVIKMKSEATASLKIENFYKRYPSSDVYSVKNFNLEVKAGEVFGFIGHNGAGKSTLIKAIVGIHGSNEGRISVCGYDMKLSPEKAKYLIGYVPDNHPLYEKLTAREYIKYIANIYMVDPKTRNERMDYYIDLFDIKKDIDKQIKTFSHGMKQKITVIASLIHEPKVWILDEPLTGLDPTSVLTIRKCITDHAKKGNIVFFSSHIIEVVENICDRIAVIKRGELMLDIKVDDAIKEYGNLTEVYKKYVLE